MSKETEANPFTSQYVRVNTKATSKGILSPDITVKLENADTTTVVRYSKEHEFEVSGYTTCFDED